MVHIKINGLEKRIKLYNMAASDSEGKDILIVSNKDKGVEWSHLPYESEQIGQNKIETITKVKIDSLVEKGTIRLPEFIKVDVEGYGHHALKGAQTAIRDKMPIVLISIHSPHEAKGIKELLLPYGYKRFDLEENPIDFDQRKEEGNFIFKAK